MDARLPQTGRPHSPVLRLLGAAAAATLSLGLLTGCAPGEPTASPSASSPAATAVALPDTALGEHAQWVIDAINGEVDDVAGEIAERASAPLLAEAGPEELAEIFAQLQAQAPWVPTAVTDNGTNAVITVTPASGQALDMHIALDDAELIAGLLFSASAAAREPAESWSELEDTVGTFAANTTLTVTEVTDGERERIAAAGGVDVSKPSGSMFKLYVLGAVADAVAAGSLTWDAPLTVTDDVKSLPSGELQDVPSGTTVTVREAAEKMISISDNTATDLLIRTVGREAVERALADMGHHDPDENTPFLMTRELFRLGWGDGGAGGAAREAWNAAQAADDDAARRAVLDTLPGGLLDIPVTDVKAAVWEDGLDWFMTPADLIAAHLALQEKASTATGEPVREILTINTGIEVSDGDGWDYVAFKGGSSMGVLAGSWYAERADGRAFVITIQGSIDDPAELGDQATFFGQVVDAFALLEEE
jgi:beta-lactamase class A